MMLRVLHCIYDDPANPWVGGGGAHRVREIYERLAGRVDATVATGRFPGARDEIVDGVRYRRLGRERPYWLSRVTFARAAARMMETGEYDVAILDFSVYTPVALPRHRPVGLVVHMLHGPTARERWGRLVGGFVDRAEQRMLERARWISTTSRWMQSQLERRAARDARVVRVGSGVSPEFASVQRREDDYVLYYGRFDLFQKGIDTLLEAFARLAAIRPGLRLRLAGRGKDRMQVMEVAGRLGIEDRIQLHADPSRPEVLELFSGALLMAAPSRLEGLPMAPAEAMAAGVPVVASDVGAVAEVIDPPHGGSLVPPADVDALTRAIGFLLSDPALREATSRSARESAKRFSWHTVADAHLAFLMKIHADQRRTISSPEPPR